MSFRDADFDWRSILKWHILRVSTRRNLAPTDCVVDGEERAAILSTKLCKCVFKRLKWDYSETWFEFSRGFTGSRILDYPFRHHIRSGLKSSQQSLLRVPRINLPGCETDHSSYDATEIWKLHLLGFVQLLLFTGMNVTVHLDVGRYQ